MSETAGYWLMVAMVLFGLFVAAGIGWQRFLYRRYGYPKLPACLAEIRLRDDLETIVKKIEPALQEGFEVQERDEEFLLLTKTYPEPSCVMRIAFRRPAGWFPWSHTSVSVECRDHAWLGWSSGSMTNSVCRRRAS